MIFKVNLIQLKDDSGGDNIGRIRHKYIKRASATIVKKYSPYLTDDFKENRAFIEKVLDVEGTLVKNRVAGYVTRLVKRNAVVK